MARLTLSPVVAGIMRLSQWQLTPQATASWILNCLDMGIDCFDSADIYGGYTAERLLGEGIKLLTPSQRSTLKIITKYGIKLTSPQRPQYLIKSYDTSEQHIRESLTRSLDDMGIERAYALLIHRPDHLCDVVQVAETVKALKQEGLVGHFGVSNHSTLEVKDFADHIEISAHQVECSPLHLDPLYDGCFKQCQSLAITPMIWSPLASGLALKPGDPRTDSYLKPFERFALEWGYTPVALLIAWFNSHPSNPVTVMGTRSLARLADAMSGARQTLSREQWYQLLRLFKGSDVP